MTIIKQGIKFSFFLETRSIRIVSQLSVEEKHIQIMWLAHYSFITMEVSYKSQKIIGIEKNVENAVQSHVQSCNGFWNLFQNWVCWYK